VTWRASAAAVGLAVVLASGLRAQDWKASAVASFDAAWQTINDTFPDPAFGGIDWAAVARELRPTVEAAASPEEARGVIRDMLARLKRSHLVLLSAAPTDTLPGPATVPVDVRIAGGSALITRVIDPAASRDGLTAGQSIVAIDGTEIGAVIARAEGADRGPGRSTRGGV
jgi:C-terminal processing protease CtpA/Prc